MKLFAVVAAAVLVAVSALAQTKPATPPTVDDLLRSFDQWAQENIDDDVLDILGEVDHDRVRAILADLERRFQTNSLYDLAPAREAAQSLVPFLQQWQETATLADWLKTRLDYLDVAEELRRAAPTLVPSPKTAPPPPPSLTLQRTIWVRQFEQRPVPPRAEAYLPRLKAVFTAEKVPPELVWVAEVESSFNPNARSPVGAEGMFQLMKSTAQTYGLSTLWPDERTDPVKSARVAARYLRHLHARFGSWSLALAAYNAGEGRVDNLLKTAHAHDYASIAGRLPAETQMYVPKCEAALKRREGITLADLKTPHD